MVRRWCSSRMSLGETMDIWIRYGHETSREKRVGSRDLILTLSSTCNDIITELVYAFTEYRKDLMDDSMSYNLVFYNSTSHNSASHNPVFHNTLSRAKPIILPPRRDITNTEGLQYWSSCWKLAISTMDKDAFVIAKYDPVRSYYRIDQAVF